MLHGQHMINATFCFFFSVTVTINFYIEEFDDKVCNNYDVTVFSKVTCPL